MLWVSDRGSNDHEYGETLVFRTLGERSSASLGVRVMEAEDRQIAETIGHFAKWELSDADNTTYQKREQ